MLQYCPGRSTYHQHPVDTYVIEAAFVLVGTEISARAAFCSALADACIDREMELMHEPQLACRVCVRTCDVVSSNAVAARSERHELSSPVSVPLIRRAKKSTVSRKYT